MRRMNIYREEVERISGWETSRMRMATETTTKGGGEGWYYNNVVNGKKSDEEGQEDVGNNHGSLLILLLPSQMDLSLVLMLVKIWDAVYQVAFILLGSYLISIKDTWYTASKLFTNISTKLKSI